MPPSCPVSSRDHDTASRCSELHLPGASHRTCAVGLVGGCLGAPWEAPWAPKKLFGLGWWRHYLIKADEKRLFCFVKKIKKLSVREKNQYQPERKKKRKTDELPPRRVPWTWCGRYWEKAPKWIRLLPYYKLLLLGSLPLLRTFHSSVEHSYLLSSAVTFGKVMSEFKMWIFLVTLKCSSLEAPTSLLARREAEICSHRKLETLRRDLFCIKYNVGALTAVFLQRWPLGHTCTTFSSSLLKRWAEPVVSALFQKNHATVASSWVPGTQRKSDQRLTWCPLRNVAGTQDLHECSNIQREAAQNSPWGLPSLAELPAFAGGWAPESPCWFSVLALSALRSSFPVSLPCLPCLTLAGQAVQRWASGRCPDCFPSHATSVKTRSTAIQRSFSSHPAGLHAFPEQSSSQEGVPGVALGARELTFPARWSSIDLSMLSLLCDQPHCNHISSKVWVISDWLYETGSLTHI